MTKEQLAIRINAAFNPKVDIPSETPSKEEMEKIQEEAQDGIALAIASAIVDYVKNPEG